MAPLPKWIAGRGAIVGIELAATEGNATAYVMEQAEKLLSWGVPLAGLWMQDWVGMRDDGHFGKRLPVVVVVVVVVATTPLLASANRFMMTTLTRGVCTDVIPGSGTGSSTRTTTAGTTRSGPRSRSASAARGC